MEALRGLQAGPLSLMGLLAAMALLPFVVVMLTSFSKILVVLSLARSALGTQQAPPTLVITALAAVLTGAVMAPVLERMHGRARVQAGTMIDGKALLASAQSISEPLRAFLLQHGSAEERARFVELSRELRTPDEADLVRAEDWFVVIPAFVLTELREAFQLGFVVFLPFLVLDVVVANILMALGMQTLPPSQVSLPLKLLLFVSVDGWALITRGLLLGYR